MSEILLAAFLGYLDVFGVDPLSDFGVRRCLFAPSFDENPRLDGVRDEERSAGTRREVERVLERLGTRFRTVDGDKVLHLSWGYVRTSLSCLFEILRGNSRGSGGTFQNDKFRILI